MTKDCSGTRGGIPFGLYRVYTERRLLPLSADRGHRSRRQ
jgi:hypothetical protein